MEANLATSPSSLGRLKVFNCSYTAPAFQTGAKRTELQLKLQPWAT